MSYHSKPLIRMYQPLLPYRKRQQGVAIIMALFIMALVATMAYLMLSQLARDTQRTSLILRDTQAELYAQSSVASAIEQLRRNWENQKPNRLIDVMPLVLPASNMNGYQITTTINDMQARFNLNNLNDGQAQAGFKNLLQLLVPDLPPDKAQAIVMAVADWITPGAGSAEYKQYYMELPEPYRAAHRPMVNASELRLVKGVTPSLYQALKPYVTALPMSSYVNVQSASAPVLTTLSPTMTLAAAKGLTNLRVSSPFVSPQQFLNTDIIKNHPISADKIVTVSRYFLIESKVTIENQQTVLYTLVDRVVQNNKPMVNVLWQSKGME